MSTFFLQDAFERVLEKSSHRKSFLVVV